MVEFDHPARVEDFLAEPMGIAWDWNKLRAVRYRTPSAIVPHSGARRYSRKHSGDPIRSAQSCSAHRWNVHDTRCTRYATCGAAHTVGAQCIACNSERATMGICNGRTASSGMLHVLQGIATAAILRRRSRGCCMVGCCMVGCCMVCVACSGDRTSWMRRSWRGCLRGIRWCRASTIPSTFSAAAYLPPLPLAALGAHH